jgi:hypothetical protein
MALTYDQIEVDKVYTIEGKKIVILNKHLGKHYNENDITYTTFECIIYSYLDNPITKITSPFDFKEIFAVPELKAPPPLMGLFPRMEVYNKHVPTIICKEDGKIEKVVIPDNAHTPHILSIDMGDGKMVDLPTYNRIIIDKFYNTPTKETSLEFLKISEIRGLEGSLEEQISKILEHFPDGIIII